VAVGWSQWNRRDRRRSGWRGGDGEGRKRSRCRASGEDRNEREKNERIAPKDGRQRYRIVPDGPWFLRDFQVPGTHTARTRVTRRDGEGRFVAAVVIRFAWREPAKPDHRSRATTGRPKRRRDDAERRRTLQRDLGGVTRGIDEREATEEWAGGRPVGSGYVR
jgi:hypothetical protein